MLQTFYSRVVWLFFTYFLFLREKKIKIFHLFSILKWFIFHLNMYTFKRYEHLNTFSWLSEKNKIFKEKVPFDQNCWKYFLAVASKNWSILKYSKSNVIIFLIINLFKKKKLIKYLKLKKIIINLLNTFSNGVKGESYNCGPKDLCKLLKKFVFKFFRRTCLVRHRMYIGRI